MKRSGMLMLLFVGFVLLACQLTETLTPSPGPSATPSLAAGATRARTPVAAQPTAAPPTLVPIVESTPTPIPEPVMMTAKDTLRIRAAPSTTAAILDKLNPGDKAQIVGRTAASDWWQIILPTNQSARGWVSAAFTDVSGPTDSIPVVGPGAPGVQPTVARPPQQPQPQPSPTRPRSYPYP